MNMTHYMELLATNQPWNLIIYMLIPVALAVVFSLLAMTREKEKSQVFPKVLFFLSVVIFLTIIAKDVFVEDKIVDDQQFIQEKQESVQDAKILLEGLDSVR